MAKSNTALAGERALTRIQLYKRVFDTHHGRLLIHDLMKSHGMLSSNFKDSDVNNLLLREGERGVVLRILQILKTDPKDLLKRIEEHEAANS